VTAKLTVAAALAQSGLVPVDGRVLMMHVLGVDRAWLVAHDRDLLAADQADAFFALAKRRRDGEPIAYLTGRREFHGLDLVVTPAVLIPRPETEALVDLALSFLPPEAPAAALDLGTGSGAIALAIANARPRAEVTAVDRSRDALDVARANASRLAIANVRFIESDWYAAVPAASFDVIVSNPPYVAPGDPHLLQGDVRHEPRVALVPPLDGLSALRSIVAGAPSHLRPGGLLAVEHGHDQADAVRRLFEAAGLVSIVSRRDLAGVDRVVAGRTAGT